MRTLFNFIRRISFFKKKPCFVRVIYPPTFRTPMGIGTPADIIERDNRLCPTFGLRMREYYEINDPIDSETSFLTPRAREAYLWLLDYATGEFRTPPQTIVPWIPICRDDKSRRRSPI